MTATYAYDDQPSSGHPLRPGASPHAIRAGLLPDDRPSFDEAYEHALTEARETLDLTGLFRVLEHWRRVALMQSDRDAYRRAVRRAAKLATGEESPTDEPLSVTRTKAGM
ncbi:DUF6247 family protein [Nocardia sp. NPDC004654]|uniref:DUF6247 family protein n=1 Tax=Nocardia sp. NPDC004654 TaxID=3154776 RepID=UPI0033B867A2